MIFYLIKFFYEKFFKTHNNLLNEIEKERALQIPLIHSIYISIQNVSFMKKKRLEQLPKNKNLDMIILAHYRVLELNPLIRELGTKRMEVLQRKYICMQYYRKQKCSFIECNYAHIVNQNIAQNYYCRMGIHCYDNQCIFIHDTEKDYNIQSETICGICHDEIKNTEKRFGLLQNCNHIYCLDCIKTYRSGKLNSSISLSNRLKCPICRIPSRYILPSNYNLKGDHKQKNFAKFIKNRKEKPCKYGISCSRINTCPFKHT